MLWLRGVLFTIIVPGAVAGGIPWLILSGTDTGWPSPTGAIQYAAGLLFFLGLTVYARCLWEFIEVGQGTPSPIDAPRFLVVTGPYRYVRNPMYLGVFTILLAEAAFFVSPSLAGYSLLCFIAWHAFTVLYEEPTHRRRFGDSWDRYARNVGRWIPGTPFVLAAPQVRQRSNTLAAALQTACDVMRIRVLEEGKLFAVVDRIVDLFQSGTLPTARGAAGERLEQYSGGSESAGARARAETYARVLGIESETAGDAVPNRDFGTLWRRFLDAVSEYTRQATASDSDAGANSVPADAAHDAARDLAANLAAQITAETAELARSVSRQATIAAAIVSDAAILRLFDAHDMWQVIDTVSERYLDKAAGVTTYRDLASEGSAIIGWLSSRADAIAAGTDDVIPEPDVVRKCFGSTGRPIRRPQADCSPPGPCGFLTAVERWRETAAALEWAAVNPESEES